MVTVVICCSRLVPLSPPCLSQACSLGSQGCPLPLAAMPHVPNASLASHVIPSPLKPQASWLSSPRFFLGRSRGPCLREGQPSSSQPQELWLQLCLSPPSACLSPDCVRLATTHHRYLLQLALSHRPALGWPAQASQCPAILCLGRRAGPQQACRGQRCSGQTAGREGEVTLWGALSQEAEAHVLSLPGVHGTGSGG